MIEEKALQENPGKINTSYLHSHKVRERPDNDECPKERSFRRTVECRLQKQQYNCTSHHHPLVAYVLATPKTIWRPLTHNKINKSKIRKPPPPERATIFHGKKHFLRALQVACENQRKRGGREWSRKRVTRREAQQKQEAINDKYTQPNN